jgi:hypothetical protein
LASFSFSFPFSFFSPTPPHLLYLSPNVFSQVLQAQGAMQTLLLDGYTWSFKQCTTSGSGPQLSAKEKRCIVQGVTTYVEARSHIGQSVNQSNGGHE